jgi:hypothetical protein
MSIEQRKFLLSKFNNRNALFSEFQSPKKKPLISIFDCKNKSQEEIKEKDVIKIDSYGLFIRTHRENREKVKIQKEKPKRVYYDFFEKHKNCSETEYYWKDLLHPKILKHYSKEKKSIKRPFSFNIK